MREQYLTGLDQGSPEGSMDSYSASTIWYPGTWEGKWLWCHLAPPHWPPSQHQTLLLQHLTRAKYQQLSKELPGFQRHIESYEAVCLLWGLSSYCVPPLHFQGTVVRYWFLSYKPIKLVCCRVCWGFVYFDTGC